MATTTNLGWTLPSGWLTDMGTAIQSIDTALNTASTTLVAGSKAVSIAGLTTGAVVLVNRVSIGGTPGFLSVVPTAGTLTITSSSGTDTSVVSYMILKY